MAPQVQYNTFGAVEAPKEQTQRSPLRWAVLAASTLVLTAVVIGMRGGMSADAPATAEDWPNYMHKGGWHCHGSTTSCAAGINTAFKKGNNFDINREKAWLAEGCVHPDDWLGKDIYIVSQKEGKGGGMKVAIHNDCNAVPNGSTRPGTCLHRNEGPWEWWTLKKKDSQYYFVSGRARRWRNRYLQRYRQRYRQRYTACVRRYTVCTRYHRWTHHHRRCWSWHQKFWCYHRCRHHHMWHCYRRHRRWHWHWWWRRHWWHRFLRCYYHHAWHCHRHCFRHRCWTYRITHHYRCIRREWRCSYAHRHRWAHRWANRWRWTAWYSAFDYTLRASGTNVIEGTYNKDQSQWSIEACEDSTSCPKAKGEYSVALKNVKLGKYLSADDRTPAHNRAAIVGGLGLAAAFGAKEQFKIVTVSSTRNGGFILSPTCKSQGMGGNLEFPLDKEVRDTGVCTIKAVCTGTGGSCSTTHNKFLLSNFKDAKTFHWGAAAGNYKWLLKKTNGITTMQSSNGNLKDQEFMSHFHGNAIYTVAVTIPCTTSDIKYNIQKKSGTILYEINAKTQTVAAKNGATSTWWSCSKCTTGATHFGCSGHTPGNYGKRYPVVKVDAGWKTAGQYLQSNVVEGGEAKWSFDRDTTRAWKINTDWRTGLTEIRRQCTGQDCTQPDRTCLHSNAAEAGKFSLGGVSVTPANAAWTRKRKCNGGSKVVSLGYAHKAISQVECAAACMRHRSTLAFGAANGNCCQYNAHTNGVDRCILQKSAALAYDSKNHIYSFITNLYGWRVDCAAPKYEGVCTIQAVCAEGTVCGRTNNKYWSSNLHSTQRTSWGGYNSDSGKTSAHGFKYSWVLSTSYVQGVPVTTIASHCLVGHNGCSATNGKYFQSNIKNGQAAKWGSEPNSNFAWVMEEQTGGLTYIKRHCTGGGCEEPKQYLRPDSDENKGMSIGDASAKYAWKIVCTNTQGTGGSHKHFSA